MLLTIILYIFIVCSPILLGHLSFYLSQRLKWVFLIEGYPSVKCCVNFSHFLAHLNKVEMSLSYSPCIGVGIGGSVDVLVKVVGASPFSRNYKPYLDQTCMDDASMDGHYQTCFRCWMWPTFSRWVTRLKFFEQFHSEVTISWFSSTLTKLEWMMHLWMDTSSLASDVGTEWHLLD